ncbi:hypothetical protein SAMN05216268_13442 [Streptomyces yunnanensis]|uniref:Uncharacterized protein n=1 Tax=Streptomyces yunnanensis TaxID=156453 RepID=A0A9X8N932_9ACTN|nr:hypothetical protein SAMN05216268_13442 [Streptomyces yunnanensis]
MSYIGWSWSSGVFSEVVGLESGVVVDADDVAVEVMKVERRPAGRWRRRARIRAGRPGSASPSARRPSSSPSEANRQPGDSSKPSGANAGRGTGRGAAAGLGTGERPSPRPPDGPQRARWPDAQRRQGDARGGRGGLPGHPRARNERPDSGPASTAARRRRTAELDDSGGRAAGRRSTQGQSGWGREDSGDGSASEAGRPGDADPLAGSRNRRLGGRQVGRCRVPGRLGGSALALVAGPPAPCSATASPRGADSTALVGAGDRTGAPLPVPRPHRDRQPEARRLPPRPSKYSN